MQLSSFQADKKRENISAHLELLENHFSGQIESIIDTQNVNLRYDLIITLKDGTQFYVESKTDYVKADGIVAELLTNIEIENMPYSCPTIGKLGLGEIHEPQSPMHSAVCQFIKYNLEKYKQGWSLSPVDENRYLSYYWANSKQWLFCNMKQLQEACFNNEQWQELNFLTNCETEDSWYCISAKLMISDIEMLLLLEDVKGVLI